MRHRRLARAKCDKPIMVAPGLLPISVRGTTGGFGHYLDRAPGVPKRRLMVAVAADRTLSGTVVVVPCSSQDQDGNA